jgi:hypothetical protein
VLRDQSPKVEPGRNRNLVLLGFCEKLPLVFKKVALVASFLEVDGGESAVEAPESEPVCAGGCSGIRLVSRFGYNLRQMGIPVGVKSRS